MKSPLFAAFALLTSLAGPLSAVADELGLPIAFEPPQPRSSPLGDLLEVPGASLHASPGAPLLPVRPLRLALPPGQRVVAVELEQVRSEMLAGRWQIAPAQHPVPLSAKIRPAPTLPDPAIYGADQPVPARWFESAGVQSSRGYRVLTVRLHPLRYSPASGRVERLDRARLVVRTAPGAALSRLYRARPEDRAALARRLDHARALDGYPKQAATPRIARLDPGDYRYLIVAPQQFLELGGDDSLEALAAARAAGGLPAHMVALEWVVANYDGQRPDGGQDDATRVRQFLTEAYQEWGVEYVLLVGDADGADNGGESGDDLMPVRKFYVEIPRQDGSLIDTIPADLYYSCLDGSFDHDADGDYGEFRDGPDGGVIDLMAELLVGRVAADSATEVRRFVAKTLAYEAAAGNWLKEVWMLGEWLFEGPVWGGDYMDDIITGSSMGGIDTLGFDSLPFFECQTLYDRELGGAESWGADELLPILDAGPHVVNHLGHSNEMYNMRLQNQHADGLVNAHPFFQYSQGCYNGSFDNQVDESGYIYQQDCFAEHLSLAEHGAFAVVANARYGWGGYGRDGVSQRFHREFWDAFFSEGLTSLGQALAYSKEDNAWAFSDPYFRWVGYESNLFGDPAVRLKKNLGTDGPLIGVYPPELTFFARAGDEELQQVELTVVNDGVGSLSWSASSEQAWLSASPAAGGDGDGIEVSVDASGLAAGIHLGELVFEAPGADNSPFVFVVTLTVIEPAVLQVPQVGTDAQPVIDGELEPGEWARALPRAIDPGAVGQVMLHSMVCGDVLYLAVDDRRDDSNSGRDQMRLYFDKNLDGLWPLDEASSDEGEYLLLDGVTYWWLLFNDGAGLGGPDYPEANPDGVAMDYGFQDDHRVYEMSVDLVESMLDVGPQGSFGMLLWVADLASGQRDYTGVFPPDMPRHNEQQFVVDHQRFFGRVELDPGGDQLTAQPRELVFEAVPDRPAPASAAVALDCSEPDCALALSAASDRDWLQVELAGDSTPTALEVAIDHTGLELGEYHGTLILHSAGAWNTPFHVPVLLRVLPSPPHIVVDQQAFSLAAAAGGPNPTVELLVSNSGGRPLDLSCEPAAAWLAAEPAGAILAPGTDRSIALTVDLDQLEVGQHSAELLLRDEQADNSPLAVTVDLEVLAEQAVPPVADLAIERRDAELALSWRNPDSPLLAEVVVRRDRAAPPAAPHLGSAVYSGLDEAVLDAGLENGTTYCYAVFTRDQAGRNSAAVTGCAAPGPNRPPPPPVHRSPADGVVLNAAPELVVDAVIDPDGDAVTVEFQLLDEAEQVVEQGSGRVDGQRVLYAVEAALSPGAGYTWQARANDALGADSGWTAAWSFRLRQQQPDGGSPDGGDQPDDGGDGGCGCNSSGRPAAGLALLGLLLLGLLRRRGASD